MQSKAKKAAKIKLVKFNVNVGKNNLANKKALSKYNGNNKKALSKYNLQVN